MNKRKTFFTLAILIFALSLSACTTGKTANTQNQGNNAPAASASSQSYTIDDLKMHASRTDCWTAIDGKVYDLTSYIATGQHKPIIVDGCGIDSSAMFAAQSKHSGTKAQNQLSSLQIGLLQ